jgi:hypothetical protein
VSIGLADIFASVRLNLETGKFETDALKSATLVSGKMGNILKKAAGGALGAGMGMAFAAATQGALELNAAQADYVAQTGASAEAAKEFGSVLADLNKTNVQSISEIGDALTGLQLHFKISGAAAKDLGARFLDFSRIAGVTARESVNKFDELVDSGVITIEQMAGMMDQLTVSHQKFGVSINGTIDALVGFAPAMKAAGISTDTALGLMNMFTEAGLNAEAASKAFNKALTKVKSPEELQRLIDDITATEDPFERAKKAVDLFGARAGVKMANALKPGEQALADFIVTAEESAGAATEAGDALDESFGNKAKLILKQFSGTLAEVGTSMGDLLLVAAMLGPGLTRGLLAGLGGLAGLLGPKIAAAILATQAETVAASGVVGTASGTAMGTAAGVALKVAFVAAALGAGVLAARALYEGFSEAAGMPGASLDEIAHAQLAKAGMKFSDDGQAAGTAIASGITEAMHTAEPTVRSAGAELADGAREGYSSGARDMVNAAKATVADVRQAIIDGKASIISAWSTALQERNDIANTKDQLLINNAEKAAALKVINDKHSTAVEKAEARIRLRNLNAANYELLAAQSTHGTKFEQITRTKALLASKALDKGLRDKDPEVRQHWLDVKSTLEKQLGKLEGTGYNYGADFSSGFLAGLKSKNVAVASQAANLIRLMNLNPEGAAFGGPVKAGVPRIVGEKRPELFIPEADGYILPSVPSGFGEPGQAVAGARVDSRGDSSGGMTFVYAPTYSTASPGEAQRFAESVGPVLSRWQQDRRLIGAR